MKVQNDHPFFALTLKERMGIYLVLVISLTFCFLPRIVQTFFVNQASEIRYQDLTKEIFATQERENVTDNNKKEERAEQTASTFHAFDPNTIDEYGWVEMGLERKTAKTIKNYLEKGGRFKKPDDLRKIWGLKKELCDRMIPYIVIQPQFRYTSSEALGYRNKDTFLNKKRTWNNLSIFINSADSATWETLPGIGPALARRIVSYREKLGGFVSVNQLSEVWNLPDSVFQKIKNKLKFDGKVRKLNLNQSGLEEFGRHPYFGFRLAKMIVNYREQHGLFQTLEDIQKIAVIDKNKYDRISPYLTIESHTP